MARPLTMMGLGARVGEHAIGLTIAGLFIAPIAWTALSSLKPAQEARQPPLPPWPTSGITTENYAILNGFGDGIWQSVGNSTFVALATVALILATIMIPFQSILTPIFLILTRLGLQNTLTGLSLVYVTLQLPFAIFMMRNSFDAVPLEIEEAARIDGANSLQLLNRVMLPLVWPGVVTVALFAFLNSWNEFLGALVLTTDQSKFTLPVMMTAVQSGRFGAIDWGAVQAGVTVMMAPCLVLFLLLQRFYIRGLTAGAVK
jgi:multiple sugar transport system permease protein